MGNGQPREPALCQLYRHTFAPYRQIAANASSYLRKQQRLASLHQPHRCLSTSNSTHAITARLVLNTMHLFTAQCTCYKHAFIGRDSEERSKVGHVRLCVCVSVN